MRQITCPHCADTYPDFDVAHVCSRGPYAPKLKPRMNERIRQLVRQAGLDDADFPIENWDNVPLAKFAELIVQECANIADIAEPFLASDLIKQQFGVEK